MLTLSSCKNGLLPFFPHKSNSILFLFLKRLLSKQLSLVEKKDSKRWFKKLSMWLLETTLMNFEG